MLGIAQTGTGKTAAFALPLLSSIDEKQKTPQILVLTPTRERLFRSRGLQSYAKHLKGHVLPLYGGADIRSQPKALKRGAQIIVGTPGRTLDHLKPKALIFDR